MSKKNKTLVLVLLLAVVLLAAVPFLTLKDAEFGGSDDAGSVMVEEIHGEYEPWFTPVLEEFLGKEIPGEVESLAVGIDLVKKSGAWYAYEGEKIGQGRENAKAYLTSHPEVMEELDRKVRQHYHLIEGEEEVKESDLKLTPKEEQMELSIEGEE